MVLSAAARAAIRVASRAAPKRRVVRRAVKKVKKIVEKSRVGKAVDSAILYPMVRQKHKQQVGLGVIRKDRKLSAGETLRIQRMKMRIPGVIIGGSIDKTADKVERFGLKHSIKVLHEEPGVKYWIGGGALSVGIPVISASHPESVLYLGDKTKKPKPKDKKGGSK